ncbi:MAG TPA: HAMP domain-containing sensor histidine kinase [Chitinophagaceae bacterium]|nr:HAMP domain-containing sensor histidine kinase [Chitinophagaceae bacterium]
MKRLQWLAILMVVAILGITGFQLFWLKQNYAREERSLAMKTDLAFRETIMQLQVLSLDLDSAEWTGLPGKPRVKLLMNDKDNMKVRMSPHKQEIISTIDVVRDKLRDSQRRAGKGEMIISMNKTNSLNGNGDTLKITKRLGQSHGGRDYVFNMLYGVDSLRDTLKIADINVAYKKSLDEEHLDIPFTIYRLDSTNEIREPSFNEVTVGFANPITYRLQTGNTFPYLMRQIMQPILFSFLLLGVTILSFVLLYRNLLKQQRLAELKNEFISNITHELKTPIATVGVAIEALKNFNAIQDPQRTKEYLDISGHELQRLSLLVDKVLRLSMFEKKEVELKYEPVDLYELVQEVTASLKLQFEKYHADVRITHLGDVNLQGDRLHLLSVIFNLLDNALKYGKENPVIQIDLAGNDSHVVLKVIDNGIGIAPAYKEKIFEKFFRIPHGDTHNAKGYGLGLSYAAQVIKKHKGTIAVESDEGQQTVFTVTLPKQRP